MRTAEARERMIVRVKKAFKAHRTFASWPEAEGGDVQVPVEQPATEGNYVQALHSLCALAEPLGRSGNCLVGRKVEDVEPERRGRSFAVGRGKGL